MKLLNLLTHLGFGAILALFSLILTYVMARYVQIMDVPNRRSMHKVPVPKSGGVAIVATFLVGSLLIYKFADVARIEPRLFWTFIVCGLCLAAVSFYDDLRQKSFLSKLYVQIACGVAVSFAGLVVNKLSVPYWGEVDLGYFGYVLTFFWIVGLINAFNFMDGMDGLAGGVGLIAAMFMCGIALEANSAYVYMTSYVLAAALTGFVILNMPPARIFMGDVGSAFVGYSFAVLGLLGAAFDRGHLPIYVIPLLLFQFIFDTVFTFIRRLMKGEKVYEAHRSHLYQLLPELGYSHRQIIYFHYGVAFAQGLGALVMVNLPPAHKPLAFLPFLIFNACYAHCIMVKAKRLRLV